jgi:hypothetical protein
MNDDAWKCVKSGESSKNFFHLLFTGPDVLQDTPSLSMPEVEDMKRECK